MNRKNLSMNHYPLDAYRQLFPQYQQSDNRSLLPEDNRNHYCTEPNFFEWWYFDMAFSDGSWCVAVLHSALYCLGDHKPTVDLRYYPAEGAPVVATGRFSRNDCEVACDHFRVRIGESMAFAKNGGYRLHVKQGALEAEFSFAPLIEGVKLGSGHLFADSSRRTYFNWVVPVPLAKVKGSLRVNGDIHMVEGVGYHDHNWGNIYLRNAFQSWIWGRVWGEKEALVFGELIASKEMTRVTPLFFGSNGKVCSVPEGFRLRTEGSIEAPRIGTSGFQQLFLEAEGASNISLSLSLQKPMETGQIAALRSWLVPWRRLVEPVFYLSQQIPLLGRVIGTLVGRGFYSRSPAYGTLHRNNETIEVQGLVEKMDLKPDR
ncbi:MAG: hypothetical protein GY797_04885 [Deltaproteobacteria bacterium]|nr:hypothetical protein [Deltaproteobacteria bacterium]